MEEKFHERAVEIVLKIEKGRARKKGLQQPKETDDKNRRGTNTCGYDIECEDRHIEVKSFTKIRSYKELTSRQTEIMKKDSKYFLYVVEKNNDEKTYGADVFAIPQKEIIEMSTYLKIARVNGIDNKEKKERWRLK